MINVTGGSPCIGMLVSLTKGQDKLNANNQSMLAGVMKIISADALPRLYQH
jgi:hypothetical protein